MVLVIVYYLVVTEAQEPLQVPIITCYFCIDFILVYFSLGVDLTIVLLLKRLHFLKETHLVSHKLD